MSGQSPRDAAADVLRTTAIEWVKGGCKPGPSGGDLFTLYADALLAAGWQPPVEAAATSPVGAWRIPDYDTAPTRSYGWAVVTDQWDPVADRSEDYVAEGMTRETAEWMVHARAVLGPLRTAPSTVATPAMQEVEPVADVVEAVAVSCWHEWTEHADSDWELVPEQEQDYWRRIAQTAIRAHYAVHHALYVDEQHKGGNLLDAYMKVAAENRRTLFYLGFLARQYEGLLSAHEHIVMDTDNEQVLHARAVATFRKALDEVRKQYSAMPEPGMSADETARAEVRLRAAGIPVQDGDSDATE